MVEIPSFPFEVWTLFGRLPVALLVLYLLSRTTRQEGWQRGSLAITAWTVGNVVGATLLTSIVGAFLGGIIFFVGTLWLLRARDYFVGPLTAALLGLLAFGRLGCLLSGCCFGSPTQLPWGIVYGEGTPAQGLHRDLGLILPHAHSLPVHPIQAYEIVSIAAISSLLFALRNKVSAGSRALLALSLYLTYRAGVDPIRDWVNTPASLLQVGPLSRFQVGALLVAAVAALGAHRLRHVRPASPPAPLLESDLLGRQVALWLMLLLAAALTLAHAIPLTFVLAVTSMGLSGMLLLIGLLDALSEPRRRLITVVGSGIVLLGPVAANAWQDGHGNVSLVESMRWVYGLDEAHGKLVRLGTHGELVKQGVLRPDIQLKPQLQLFAQATDSAQSAPPALPLEPQPAPSSSPAPTAAPDPATGSTPDSPVGGPKLSPSTGVTNAPLPAPAFTPAGPQEVLWSLYGLGGFQRYSYSSCSSTTEYYHEAVVAGADVIRPLKLSNDATGYLGTRLGYYQELQDDFAASASQGAGYFLIEHPNFALGVGMQLSLLSGHSEWVSGIPLAPDDASPGAAMMPIVYARGGMPGFSVEAGTQGPWFTGAPANVFAGISSGIDTPMLMPNANRLRLGFMLGNLRHPQESVGLYGRYDLPLNDSLGLGIEGRVLKEKGAFGGVVVKGSFKQ